MLKEKIKEDKVSGNEEVSLVKEIEFEWTFKMSTVIWKVDERMDIVYSEYFCIKDFAFFNKKVQQILSVIQISWSDIIVGF